MLINQLILARILILKDKIRRATAEIQPNLCVNVLDNFTKRMESFRRSRGKHLADIIFHTPLFSLFPTLITVTIPEVPLGTPFGIKKTPYQDKI